MSRLLMPLALLLVVGGLGGCNYFVGIGYLLGGPPSIEPDFDRMTNLSLTDKDVIVAVACYAPNELKWDNSEVDREIAEYVSHRLHQHKVVVRRPEQVRQWIEKNPDWDQPEEIGKAVDVTHVVFIDLSEFSLYEKDSANLYRGRAEAIISVVAKQPSGDWSELYVKEIVSQYPLMTPRQTSQQSFAAFKRQYLEHLSDEVGRLFYEYYNGDDFPNVI